MVIKTLFVVLMFTNSQTGYATDSSFHVFQGETALEDCERVRSAMIQFAKSKIEGNWFPGTMEQYASDDNLSCVPVE